LLRKRMNSSCLMLAFLDAKSKRVALDPTSVPKDSPSFI
jgi:hypothetical protein